MSNPMSHRHLSCIQTAPGAVPLKGNLELERGGVEGGCVGGGGAEEQVVVVVLRQSEEEGETGFSFQKHPLNTEQLCDS